MLCQIDKTHKRRSSLRLLCLWLLTFVAGCELPQKPGDLWWEIDLNVPFGVRTYGIWELADPDTTLRRIGSGVGMEDDSSVYFSAWADMSAEIGDSLYVKSVELSISRFVTAIEAPLDYDTLLQLTLGTLNPDIAAFHGTTQNISAHPLNGTINLPFPFGYDSLEVDTGAIRIIVANRLPYPTTNIEIRAGSKLIVDIATLATDQQAVIDTVLNDAVLNGAFVLNLSATGVGGQNILVDSTDRISVTAEIDTVTASRFYGNIPEQTVTRDSALAIDQQHTIDLVIIESGNMTVTLANHTQFADTVSLRIPNLVSRLNDTLMVTHFLLPGDSSTITVPLTQYRLRPEGDADQTVTGQLISHSPQTPDVRSFEGDGEYVYGRIELEQLSVQYFEGTLNNLELSFDSLSIDIERPPQGWEVVRPLEVEARIHVDHGIGGVLDADLNAATWLNGTQIGQSLVSVNDLALEDSAVAIIPGLADLLADYPDQMTSHGDAVLSGQVAIFNNTIVSLGVELRAALSVTITDTLSPVGTVEKVEPQDLQDIVGGTATIKLWNHLPLGGRCFLVADFDSNNVIEGSTADVDTLFDVDIPPPTIVNGRATNASEYQLTINFDQRWLDYFKSEQFFVRTQIAVATAIGDTMIVHGTDYLSVQALAKVTYEVHPGEVE